jgi:phage major head subunit gpT-like protein
VIISPATLDAIYYGFNTRYTEAYKNAPTFFGDIATDMPSLGRETRYAWMDRLPRMKEWVGSRVLNSASLREFTVVNKNYEDTIKVDRNQIEDDQVGVLNPVVDMLGLEAKILPDRLMTDLLVNGNTSSGVCFDGQNFFNSSHPTDIDNPTAYPVQSNLLTASPLSSATYAAARSQMRQYKGKDNLPLGVIPDCLMVHTDQEEIAREILTGEFVPGTITSGAVSGAATRSNVYKGSAKLIVNPYLTTTGEWYLFDSSKPVRPFVRQTRRAPELVPLINPTDRNVFFDRQYIWGVDSREAMGYGLWFLGMKVLPS